MRHYNRTTRFFAAMLGGGGFVGMALVVFMCVKLIQQSVLVAMLIAALGALFAWAGLTGVRLWQGTRYGRKWAVILFASQMPVLAIPGFKYQWFTGAPFGPVLSFGGSTTNVGATINLGANAEFFVGSGMAEWAIGLNLFAAIAVVLLMRANRSFNTAP